jgi:hypothetical protein
MYKPSNPRDKKPNQISCTLELKKVPFKIQECMYVNGLMKVNR